MKHFKYRNNILFLYKKEIVFKNVVVVPATFILLSDCKFEQSMQTFCD